MNIRLSYEYDYTHFKDMFPELELFNWEKDKDEKIDLLIFPGGEDVSLSYYLDPAEIKQYTNMCSTNKKRDEYEKDILLKAVSGELNVNKILGICRGTQLINVVFGGELFPDLEFYNIKHGHMHRLHHNMNSNLRFFEIVNSLHHQGIRGDPGKRIKGINIYTYPRIIAYDETGYVTEIASWLNDKVLGMQFHPEYYADSDGDKIKFKEFLLDWVDGKKTILMKGESY